LLTLPLHEWEAVLGKFLAAWTILAVYLAITLVYPIAVAFLGRLDWGPVIGGYLGLLLLGSAFVALGLFASTISRNQVISLIVGVVIALALFVIDLLLPFLPLSLQNVAQFVGVDSHFQNISRGVIDTRDLIYSLSLSAFLLFAATQSLQTRLADHSRTWRLNRALYIGAATGALIAVNAASYLTHGRLDLTQDKQFTLSPATREMLTEMSDHLTATAYFSRDIPPPANNTPRVLRDVLEEYRAASDGKMSYSFVDPDAAGKDGKPDPALASQAQAAGVPKIDMQTYRKDQVQAVKVYLGLALQYGDKTETLPVVSNLPDLEYEISSRLAKLLRDKTPVIGVITGHGELTKSAGMSRMAGALGAKYELKEVNLTQGDAGLETVDAVIIAGPKQQFKDAEVYAIDQFVMRGGKVAFFLDRGTIDMRSLIGQPLATGLEDLIASYGVVVHPSLTLDNNCERVPVSRGAGNVTFQSLVPFPAIIHVQDLAPDTPLTKNLNGFTLPFAAPLELRQVNGVNVSVIARSSPQTSLFELKDSFLADPGALPPPTPDDLAGAQNLVATLSGQFPSYYNNRPNLPTDDQGNEPQEQLIGHSPDTRMVVVGSSWWVSDQMPSRLNALFFANLIDWLLQDERLMSIRTRSIDNRPLKQLGDAQRAAFKYGNMLLPALLLTIYGVVRWRRRLRRKKLEAALFAKTAGGEE
jgi:gliding-associated putative ABC transporter substrate-binding component GldG